MGIEQLQELFEIAWYPGRSHSGSAGNFQRLETLSIVRVFQYSFASEGVSVVTTEITDRSIRISSISAIA